MAKAIRGTSRGYILSRFSGSGPRHQTSVRLWNYASARRSLDPMCRNIRTLYNFEPPATSEEIEAAALQYVRKISGFTKPSAVNEAAFYAAIAEVTAASARLLESLETNAPAKDREIEAAKRKAAAVARYG